MRKELNKDWLEYSLSRHGYCYTEEEWNNFSSKLLADRKSTRRRIKETFDEDEEPVIIENLRTSPNTLSAIVKSLEKFYKQYLDYNAFKKLILSAILQYEKIHCCVLRSEGENNVFKMAGEKNPSFAIPFQLLVITLNGMVKHSTDRYSSPVSCSV